MGTLPPVRPHPVDLGQQRFSMLAGHPAPRRSRRLSLWCGKRCRNWSPWTGADMALLDDSEGDRSTSVRWGSEGPTGIGDRRAIGGGSGEAAPAAPLSARTIPTPQSGCRLLFQGSRKTAVCPQFDFEPARVGQSQRKHFDIAHLGWVWSTTNHQLPRFSPISSAIWMARLALPGAAATLLIVQEVVLPRLDQA
jgi:hypothetical protein